MIQQLARRAGRLAGAAAAKTADADTRCVLPTSGAEPVPSPAMEFWHAFASNRGALAGAAVLGVLMLIALLGPWLAPHDPAHQYTDALLLPPAWAGGDWRFFLGTDDLGRDLLSRILVGTRLSLGIAAMVVAASLVVGFLLGALAGLMRGVVEALILRAMDILLALPSLLLAIVIVAILGPSLTHAVIAVAIVLLPHFVRITRAAIVNELARDYVRAARLDGSGPIRLLFVTLLPNIAAPLIVQASLAFSTAILDIAALGFLGLGAQPPAPEWGSLLAAGREFIQRAPWIVTFPGLAILITVLATNLIGDGLRDALDPRLKT